MDIRGVLAQLPHRYPFLLVDRVIECVPGKRIEAIKNVSVPVLVMCGTADLNEWPEEQRQTFDTATSSDKEIAWNLGPDVGIAHFYGYRLEPADDGATNVTAYYDWSEVGDDIKDRFPVVPESALRATLGILERTARTGL